MSLKLGCLPPVHTLESVAKGIILSEHLLALGPAPRNSDDYVSAVEKQVGTDWKMLGNNVAGNCVPADTLISGPQQKAAYKMFFSGDFLTFTLRSGKRLTVTPNHPVLTSRGFIAAKFIQHGDYFVSTSGTKVFPRSPSVRIESNFDHAPSPADQKFKTIMVAGDSILKIMPRAVNFHGDGQFLNGNVDVVTANGLLRHQSDSTLGQPHRENQIGAARQLERMLHSARSALKRVFSPLGTANRNVGVGSYRAPFGDGHRGVSQADRLNYRAQGEAVLDNRFFETLPADSAFFNEGLQGLARNVAFDPMRKVAVSTTRGYRARDAVRPLLNASFFETAQDGVPTDPQLPSYLFESFPSLIAPDRVINIENQSWTKQAVYDFSTDHQWYIANGVVTHNCTIADCGHEHMLWTANTGTIETPTDQYCLDYYKQLSGWNGVPDDPSDTGLMIAAVCAHVETTGFLGNQLQGYADVSPANFDLVKWGIQLFGCVKLGLQLPQSAMDQFDAGHGWKFTGDFNIIGGHDVTAVMYEHNVPQIITWGKRITMGPSFFLHYVTEVKVPLAINWTRLAGVAPNKLDMPQLIRDLAQEGPVN